MSCSLRWRENEAGAAAADYHADFAALVLLSVREGFPTGLRIVILFASALHGEVEVLRLAVVGYGIGKTGEKEKNYGRE